MAKKLKHFVFKRKNRLKFCSNVFLFLLPGLILISVPAISQDQKLTPKQVDSITRVLQSEIPQTSRINNLIELAWYQVRKRGENKIDLDSAKSYLDQAGNLLHRLSTSPNWGFYYLVYSSYHNESGHHPIDEEALDKAINYLKTGNQYVLLGTAYYEKMNRIPMSTEAVPVKMKWMELATEAYKKSNDKRKLGDGYRLMADLRIYLKDDPRALPELDSANRLYQAGKSGDWQQLYILYSMYYYRQGNSEKQLEYVFKALRTTGLDDNSSYVVISLYNSASVCYYRLKDNKKSLEYANNALNYAIKTNVPKQMVYNLVQGAVKCYSRLNRPQAAFEMLNRIEKKYPDSKNLNEISYQRLLARMVNYNDLKRYNLAQNFYNQLMGCIKIGRITPDSIFLSSCYNEMSHYLINSGQWHEAGKLLNAWEPIATKLNNSNIRMGYYNALIMLDTAKKDYKTAVHHLFEVRNINDSIYSSAKVRQIKEMEYQYQVDRRESESKLQKQSILNLIEQQKLQKAELRATDITKNIMLVSAVCLIVIALLIYRQFVIGKRHNHIVAKQNKNLQCLLQENEFLMKEVHHRVKNNLQIVTSLLNSQSAYLEEGNALDAIMKSKGRVEAIALIHQKLYKSESQSALYMPEYIQELTEYLKDSFIGEQKVWFDLLIDPIHLDVADAVPIGLIINESITNAIKYAFNDDAGYRENVIQISLSRSDFFHELVIRDNGRGFNDATVKGNGSFGLLLIQGLSKDLGGELIMQNDGGAVITILFSPTIIAAPAMDEALPDLSKLIN